MNTFTLASPVGFWSITSTDTHVVSVDYHAEPPLSARGPQTLLERQLDELLKRYFNGERVDFSGVPVQYPEPPSRSSKNLTRKVMERLSQIPYGEIYSYQWLAEQLGMPQAPRAIGGALGRNPIPIIVPCHRIVAKSARLGGFMQGCAEGRRIKAFLLELEGHCFQGDHLVSSVQKQLATLV
jgi:methylated-DNA-[protein]-cysteine S-methyltransferase